MINKDVRNKILNSFAKKEEKIFVAVLMDIVNKFEVSNRVLHTSFLNLHEKQIAITVLNTLKVDYSIFEVIEDIQRTVIFFIPDYLKDKDINNIYNDYIAVLKITPSVKNKLKHKNYMGTIYSLGIKEDMIGDIFLFEEDGYLFLFRSVLDYFLNNLTRVSKVEVELKVLDVYTEEVKKIHLSYISQDIIVTSLRVDTILAVIYNLSRNVVKAKIQEGDLFINSKEMFFVAHIVNENDIVSFKKYGKFKIGKTLKNTKSGRIVLNIKKYV